VTRTPSRSAPLDADRLARARVRPARTPEDVRRAARFLQTPMVEAIAAGHPEERGAIRICEVDGEICAVLVIDPMPLRLRDTDVACARIIETRGEDGRLHFRRTGDRDLFIFMIEEALGYVWLKRYPIAFLHGELALYPDHGFVPCFYHPRVYIDVATALAQPAPYRVRHLKGDDVHRLDPLRERNRRWKPVVFAAGVPPFHHFIIEGSRRTPKGYLSMQANPDARWHPRLFVPEVEVEDRAAARTVLHHCAQEARKLGLDVMHFALAAGHPLARLCLELGGHAVLKGAAHDPFLSEEMIHVLDPALLIEAFQPWFARQLASDHGRALRATLPIATGGGTWVLKIADGAVTCRQDDTRPDGTIELPQWQFTQLLAGYRGAHELDADIGEHELEALDLILPKTWPCSLPDPNVWEDVQPSEPYAEAAAALVRHTVLPWMHA